MDKLSLSSTASSSPTFFLSPLSVTKLISTRTRTLSFNLRRPRKLSIVACNDEPRNKLTEADLMEFKFGQMLGEDPKLTMAKILGRKINPEASYLEIEKNFYRNKGKIVEVKEVPFDVPKRRGSLDAKNDLNLVKPVPKPGIKVGGVNDSSSAVLFDAPKRRESPGAKSVVNIVRPVPKPGIKVGSVDDSSSKVPFDVRRPLDAKDDLSLLRPVLRPGIKVGGIDDSTSEERKPSGNKVSNGSKSNVPNIILRKPSVYNEDDDPMSESLKLWIKPNLSLKMRTDQVKDKFGGITLLKRPEPVNLNPDADGNPDNSENNDGEYSSGAEEINLPKSDVGPSNVVSAAESNEVEGARLDDVDQFLGNKECQVDEISSKLPMLERPKPFVEKSSESNAESPSSQTFSIVEKNPEGLIEPVGDDASSHQEQDDSEIATCAK